MIYMIRWVCAHKSSKKCCYNTGIVIVAACMFSKSNTHTHLTKGHPTFSTDYFSEYFHPCSTPCTDRYHYLPIVRVHIVFKKITFTCLFDLCERNESVLWRKCKYRRSEIVLSKWYQNWFHWIGGFLFCRQSIVQYTMHFMANKPNKLEIRSLLISFFAVSSSSKWNIFDYGNVRSLQ